MTHIETTGTLPPGAGGRAGAAQNPPQGAKTAAQKEGATRVFLVEDEALIAMELTERLIALGYIVCGSARRAETALRDIAELRPDIVLMDIHLAGGTNGIDTANKVKERFRIPVVFLTAYSDSALIARAVESGSYGYLVKPCQERELHAALQVALARHDFESQLEVMNASLEERVRLRTAELERALHAAEAANRAKTEFLRNVNHELRTPLNHVVLLADLLASRPVIQNDTEATWGVQNISRSSRHLTQVIERMLDLQRMGSNPGEPLRMQAVDATAIIAEAAAFAAGLAAECGIALENTAAGAMPVMADQDRLRQIIMILLSNAIKYNRRGGWAKIAVDAPDADTARITVTDSGIGLSAEQQTRVFDAFSRFVPKGEVIDGIGIGLAVARGLAAEMGGRIEVASEPGKGSCFTVTLARDGESALRQ